MDRIGRHRNERKANKAAAASRRLPTLAAASAAVLVLALVLLAALRPCHHVQVDRRQGRSPLHRQDSPGSDQQGQCRAGQAGRAGQDNGSGAGTRAAQGARGGGRAPETTRQGTRHWSNGATVRCSVRTRRKARSISRGTAPSARSMRRSNRRPPTLQRSTSASSSSTSKKAALGDKPVPPVLERELANITTELGQAGRAHRRQAEGNHDVTARYDADKRRWRELRALGRCRAEGRADHRAPVAAKAEAGKRRPMRPLFH